MRILHYTVKALGCVLKNEDSRLPAFDEFQVGPKLSSPKALPWFHILLSIRKGAGIRTVRANISQYCIISTTIQNTKLQKQVSVYLRTPLVAFKNNKTCNHQLFFKNYMRAVQVTTRKSDKCIGFSRHCSFTLMHIWNNSYFTYCFTGYLSKLPNNNLLTINWSYFLHWKHIINYFHDKGIPIITHQISP